MKYVKCDEVDLLISIERELNVETIDSKKKSELIESFKQVGRSHIPDKPKKNWIQLLDRIYDGRTVEFIFDASPNYQIINPIPWKIGTSTSIPSIDRLLVEWVGEENKVELYEFMAYLITRDRFLQRIFAFCGGGSNGKGTFMKLCTKLVGKENCIASDLKQLSESQFEPAVLYGKLMCVMGEISYADLKNTNQIKKIAGEDLISFQFKGKTPFTDENTALAVCLTNSLPSTPDKSLGFYRKWHLIDFPNQFNLISDNPIDNIPDVEFENLVLKLLEVLKGLYQKRCLTHEGNFEDRISKYEERSNPVMQFINQYCDEDNSFSIPLREFTNCCNEYLKTKHLRILTANQVGKILREEGFAVGNRRIDEISQVVILNLKFKPNITTIKTIKKFSRNPYKETTEKFNSFDIVNNTESLNYKGNLNSDTSLNTQSLNNGQSLNQNCLNNEESLNNKKLVEKMSTDEIKQAGFTKEELENILNGK